jgi:hypothetical protein
MSNTKQPRAEKIYVTRVIARIGVIPYDMMRYESCVPASDDDVHKLERLASLTSSADDHLLTFVRFSRNPGPPTVERWRSFGSDVKAWRDGKDGMPVNRKQKAARMFVTHVIAKISNVPFAMMRQEGCVPAFEGDAHKLERIAGGSATDEDRVVTFTRFSSDSRMPSIERWKTLGCSIIGSGPAETFGD